MLVAGQEAILIDSLASGLFHIICDTIYMVYLLNDILKILRIIYIVY